VKTTVLKVNAENPEREKILEAAMIIRAGGLVAFPTETVYGLGANALDPKAVSKIYKVKKRPLDNPIITHVARRRDVYRLAREVPEDAEKLIEAFWPGPLTLLLRKAKGVPRPGGLDEITVRMPANRIAIALIEASNPISAPSANLSGRPSPTTAEHVLQDLDGCIEMVLDGGPTGVGVESTILDMTAKPYKILRPGGVTLEDLKGVIEYVEVHPSAGAKAPTDIARSPGMKYRHYAPRASMILVEGRVNDIVEKVRQIVREHGGKGVGIMATEETAGSYDLGIVKVVGSRTEPRTIARNLYKTLRDFDELGVRLIIAEGVEKEGIGLAILNRLRKASGYQVIEASSDTRALGRLGIGQCS